MGPASGNGTDAARRAGYAGSPKVLGIQSVRLLAKASVQLGIAARRAELAKLSIADATERREVLSTILRSSEADATARIRAIDVHNKMDGLYIEKHEIKHEVPASVAFLISQQPGAENRT